MVVDLKIRDFKGKNWRFRVDPLFDSIAVEHCSINIKTNSISITLKKVNPKKWTSVKWITPISRSEQKKPGMSSENDSQPDSLMTMMKDLY